MKIVLVFVLKLFLRLSYLFKNKFDKPEMIYF